MSLKSLTKDAAIALLSKHNFTPGRSSTRGLPPLVRVAIKQALNFLAREAAEELIKLGNKAVRKVVKKNTKTPRKASDVKPRRAAPKKARKG